MPLDGQVKLDTLYYSPKPPRAYWPWGEVQTDDRALIAVDHAKFNLVWLAFPEVDVQGLQGIPLEVAENLHKQFDRETRAELCKRPLEFMKSWGDGSEWVLGNILPSNSVSHMALRAAEASARLLGRVDEGNVVRVNFRQVA